MFEEPQTRKNSEECFPSAPRYNRMPSWLLPWKIARIDELTLVAVGLTGGIDQSTGRDNFDAWMDRIGLTGLVSALLHIED